MAIPGIHEIQTLATKYSKAQLQKMAQMGLIDTTKAVMAGMMIDRISKQNMAPPATTVAEDALAPPVPQGPPQGAPQGPPQMGPDGAPPEVSAGIAALPSNIPEMAGGGIVAFDDGGEVQGYKEEGFVISKEKQRLRDLDRFQILAEELRQEQAMAASKTGIEKLRHEKNIEMLQREMRTIKAAPSPSNLPIASAAASEAPASTNLAPVNTGGKTLEESDREAFSSGLTNLGAAAKDVLSMPGRVAAGVAENVITRPLRAAGVDVPYLPPEFYGETDKNRKGPPSFSLTPYYDQLRTDKSAINVLPAIAAPEKVVTPPARPAASPAPEGNIVAPQEKAAPVVEQEEARPKEEAISLNKNPGLGVVAAGSIALPDRTDFAKEYGSLQDAYKQAGVDPNMYRELMDEVSARKEGSGKKKEQALGMALMMAGLGLAGARRGQEWQTLSGAGRQALAQYQGAMDSIIASDEKQDSLLREIKMAENNYKKTGAETALARVNAKQEKYDAIAAKNVEIANKAAEKQAELFVHMYGDDSRIIQQRISSAAGSKPTETERMYARYQNILEKQGPAAAGRFLSDIGALRGAGKPQNTLSYEEAAKIIYADVTIPKKDRAAAIQELLRQGSMGAQGGGGGGLTPNKDGSFNYVPGGR